MNNTVTAVGRILRPKGSEPRVHHVIAVKSDGTVKTLIKRQLESDVKSKSAPPL